MLRYSPTYIACLLIVLLQFSPGDQVKNNEMGRACGTYREQVHTRFWWQNLREIDHFKDLGVDGRMMDLTELGWEDWMWLGTSGRLVYTL